MVSETKKNIRRLDLIRGALVLTLILYIAVALIINSSYLTLDRLLRLRSDIAYALTNSGETYRPEADDTLDIVLFQDGYAALTRNGVTVCGADGNIYSSHVLQFKQPCIKTCGAYLLCFDRGGTGWALLNSFRILCSGNESGDIINGTVTEDGYFAIAAERTEYKGSVTVYNIDGLDLSRWNSDTYLIDSFFTSKNSLTVVSVSSDREQTHTVFTEFNYKKGEVVTTATAPDTFPLALGMKKDGGVEILTDSGAFLFSSGALSSTYTYSEPSPGKYNQGDDATMISYHTMNGSVLVEAFSSNGKVLFTTEYPEVVSLASSRGYFFILTSTNLFILDSSGNMVQQHTLTASEVLVSEEISVLLTSSSVDPLDLSSLP